MPLPEAIREAMFWGVALACAAAQGALLVDAWRNVDRARGARSAIGEESSGTSHPAPRPLDGAAELVLVVAPAVLMALLLLFVWRATVANSP